MSDYAHLHDTFETGRWRPLHGTPLTERELEVLRLYSLCPQKEVAHRLGINVQTVKNYLDRAYARLGVNRAIDAYVALGWLRVPLP